MVLSHICFALQHSGTTCVVEGWVLRDLLNIYGVI